MVRALTIPQVIRLISKIDYDRDLKRHFIEQIYHHLYASHKSFLSSPLLATIMLLTYEYFAEIPNKMHIFYEQAFAALFRRMTPKRHNLLEKLMPIWPLMTFAIASLPSAHSVIWKSSSSS